MKMHARQLIKTIREVGGEPLLGAEIGVWRGELSAVLLEVFPSLKLIMVDPWLPYASATMGVSDDSLSSSMQRALSVTDFASDRRVVIKATSLEAAEQQKQPLDFAFIDANHAYEYISQDVRAWWPLIRSGGVLAGHDYRSRLNASRWGVRRAVDEFSEEVGVPVENNSNVWWMMK